MKTQAVSECDMRASASILLPSLCVAVCALGSSACGHRTVDVEYRSGYTFSEAERTAIQGIAERAARDVRAQLSALPATLRLTVTARADARVIPETGETAEVGLPAGVYWTVDPTHDGGVIGVVNRQLRATLFHEFYHLVRESTVASSSLIDRAIHEGSATAFERDFGGAPTPWGLYPADVAEWTKEFLALPPDASSAEWMFRHPDGRRWIGFKVGTYLVDRAVRESAKTVAQLVSVPTAQIVSWASQGTPSVSPDPCVAIPPTAAIAEVGAFSNMRYTTEHAYGFTVLLWRAGTCTFGFLLSSQGLAEDTPIGELQDVVYDAATGALSFAARLTMGVVKNPGATEFVPTRDLYTFSGTLRPDRLAGQLLHVNQAVPTPITEREAITLPVSARESGSLHGAATYGEWREQWRPILAVRGPKRSIPRRAAQSRAAHLAADALWSNHRARSWVSMVSRRSSSISASR